MNESIESSVLEDLQKGIAGAEHGVLSTLAKFVLNGIDPSPRFQKIANLIITRSLLENKLPQKKNGRPKVRTGIDGELVAATYAGLRHQGSSYTDAVLKLAAEFHKDERQIMRIVKENKGIVAAKKLISSLPEHFPNNDVVTEINDLAIGIVRCLDALKEHQRTRTDPQSSVDADHKLISQLNGQILAAASGPKIT